MSELTPNERGDAQKLSELGASLVQRIVALMRTARTYDVSNMAFQRQMQEFIGVLRQLAVGAARHQHQQDAQAFERGDKRSEFVAFTRVGDRQDKVPGCHHAQIAVAGFGGVHEHRRSAGGRERGRNLAPDMTALAHAHHHDAAAALQHGLRRLGETVALARLQSEQGIGLDVESVARQLQGASRVEGGSRFGWGWHRLRPHARASITMARF